MEIVVNTRLLLKNRLEGIGWFSFETLRRITTAHPEVHFVFLFDRDFDEDFLFSDNITPLIIGPPARHPVLFYWWFEHSVAGILNRLKPDLFLSPDGYLSLNARCKQLPVIHDLSFAHHPRDVPFLVRKYYNYFFPKYAKRADRIATVSEFSRQDIVTHYQIDPSKIDVVYNGCNTLYQPLDEIGQAATRLKFSENCPYFLFVGALHPRKNIVRLFQAFEKYKSSRSSNTKLMIVGEKYYWTAAIKSAYLDMTFRSDVIFTGRLSSEDLRLVLASALAMVYVPYFEGFGIPILEAMQSDTPVITSDITSMPEVAGDAALLVDPYSVDAIAEAMQKIEADKTLRDQLIRKGRIRKQQFSWDKTAGLLWNSIERTIDNPA